MVTYVSETCCEEQQHVAGQIYGYAFVGLSYKSILPFNLLKPTGHVMHQQFSIQQLYALPTLYLCVLCLS